MSSRSGSKVVEAFQADLDAVRQLEAGLLAQVLQLPHDLAEQARDAEIVVEIEIEGHGEPTLGGSGEALPRRRSHLDVVGTRARQRARVQRQRDGAAGPSDLCGDGGRGRRSRAARRPRTCLAGGPETRAEAGEVRHELHAEGVAQACR